MSNLDKWIVFLALLAAYIIGIVSGILTEKQRVQKQQVPIYSVEFKYDNSGNITNIFARPIPGVKPSND